jgi:hypothetical protein
MDKILAIIFMSFASIANAQTLPAPYHLRCDFLLHTEKVSQGGVVKKIPIKSALQQGNEYQFPVIWVASLYLIGKLILQLSRLRHGVFWCKRRSFCFL